MRNENSQPAPDYRSQDERLADRAMRRAADAIEAAIQASETAGYGSHVIDPLRSALKDVRYSIYEVGA